MSWIFAKKTDSPSTGGPTSHDSEGFDDMNQEFVGLKWSAPNYDTDKNVDGMYIRFVQIR